MERIHSSEYEDQRRYLREMRFRDVRARNDPFHWMRKDTVHAWGKTLDETFSRPCRPRDEVDEPDPEWVVQGFLPRGYLCVLGAPSKSGKTCFASALALAVAVGDRFMGQETSQGTVLWLALEESPHERKQILRHWYGTQVYKEIPLFTEYSHIPVDDPTALKCLAHIAKNKGAKLIVVDPLYEATGALSLTDGAAARRALSGLKSFCRDQGVAALVLHHFTKAHAQGVIRERMADSNQIVATASMDVLMETTIAEERRITLHCTGRGEFANRKWHLVSRGPLDYEPADAPPELPNARERVLEALRECPRSAAELARELSFAEGTVRNRVSELLRAGILEISSKDGKTPIYSVAGDGG